MALRTVAAMAVHLTKKGAVVGALISTAALSSAFAPAPADAIVAGHPAPQTAGYNGSLQRIDSPRNDLHVCGATLIAPRWAVTAGHCTRWVRGEVSQPLSGHPFGWRVRFGSPRTRAGGEVVGVTRFVRISKSFDPDGDIGLLKLARPVHAKPARLATRTPKPGSSALILGWGFTDPHGDEEGYGDFSSPLAYPRTLRIATTRLWPKPICALAPRTPALCVGGEHGRPNPSNMDSGGPVFVRQPGRGLVLAGTVNGGSTTGRPGPSWYTDISAHLDWIHAYTSGRATIPPDQPITGDGLAGAASIDSCSAAVFRTPTSQDADPALLLTNGHCVEPRPAPGATISDRRDRRTVTINGPDGNAIARTSTTRLLAATMTVTDIAVFRLARTYAQLADAGVKVLSLTGEGPQPGDDLAVLSGRWQERFSCRIDALVPTLREGGYEQHDALRYVADPGCRPGPGTSGSPLVDERTREIVAIHNTHNDGQGTPCEPNNPCEVGPDGTATAVQDGAYAQQTAGLASCLLAGSRLDLSSPPCPLRASGDSAGMAPTHQVGRGPSAPGPGR
jgi:hypothetical protein